MRTLKYSEALAEATVLAMEDNPRLFLMGEGVDDPKGAFGTTLPALQKFGAKRVFDTPLSEWAFTGIGIGAAIEGAPCLMVHMRSEFLLLAMDQLVNHAAKWRYMSGGKISVPIVIRCLIGRGWGQAAQHSQSFHSFYGHVPGLKVIMPASPYDAKGLLYAALRDPDPVLCLEHRWLYDKTGYVPEGRYEVPLGKALVLAEGKDITCVALSQQVSEALAVRERLLKEGIEMEVIDVRSVKPLDRETILRSVEKTGRLMVTDVSPAFCGVTAEISALVCEQAFHHLKAPVMRVTPPDAPTPCSYALEEAYYPSLEKLISTAQLLMHRTPRPRARMEVTVPSFFGPF